MRDSLTIYVIFLVVHSENNLSCLVEVFNLGTHGEETVPDEEHEFQERQELKCTTVTCALGVFTGIEAEVEAQLDQVRDVVGLGVRGVGSCGHNGVNNV